MDPDDTLVMIAYGTFRETNWANGEDSPPWDVLSESQKCAWRSAVNKLIEHERHVDPGEGVP